MYTVAHHVTLDDALMLQNLSSTIFPFGKTLCYLKKFHNEHLYIYSVLKRISLQVHALVLVIAGSIQATTQAQCLAN